MNRGTKVVLIIMLAIIAIYVAAGLCGDYNSTISGEQNQSGDQVEVNDSGDVIEDELIQYEITSGENEVILRAITSGDIGTTKYIFENEKLVKILVTEEVLSGDFIQDIYNSMKTDENFVQIYSTINLEGNIITMELKEEYVNAISGRSKVELYEELMESMEI
ncbi:MAG: hypothetical protein IJX99_09840 [Clostridia bacterium]|nr:hypothetical protein [Clostridia bacterium]